MSDIKVTCRGCQERKCAETAYEYERGQRRPECKACERQGERERKARATHGLAARLDSRNIAFWVGSVG